MIKSLTSKQKSPEIYDRNWWWMVYGKSAKGPKLGKKHKISRMNSLKLYEVDK